MLHSETEESQQKVLGAKIIISDALKQFKKPYVAFSGGKDSTCVLHAVLQQRPNTMVLHWDYGHHFIPRELHQEIIENSKAIGVNLRVETSEEYGRLGREAVNVLGRDMIKNLIPQLIKEGYDAVFVGLRKQESVKRKMRINNNRWLTKMPEIFPVQAWSWLDVWAYIISNNIPYLSHYDKYGCVVGWDRARFTTLFDPEFDKFGCSNVDGVLSWKWRNNYGIQNSTQRT